MKKLKPSALNYSLVATGVYALLGLIMLAAPFLASKLYRIILGLMGSDLEGAIATGDLFWSSIVTLILLAVIEVVVASVVIKKVFGDSAPKSVLAIYLIRFIGPLVVAFIGIGLAFIPVVGGLAIFMQYLSLGKITTLAGLSNLGAGPFVATQLITAVLINFAYFALAFKLSAKRQKTA